MVVGSRLGMARSHEERMREGHVGWSRLRGSAYKFAARDPLGPPRKSALLQRLRPVLCHALAVRVRNPVVGRISLPGPSRTCAADWKH